MTGPKDQLFIHETPLGTATFAVSTQADATRRNERESMRLRFMQLKGEEAAALGLREEPGWVGAFSRNQVPGFYRNTSRVTKVRGEKGDATPLGTMGTVLGSLSYAPIGSGYFIEWDTTPRHATFVIDWKVSLLP